MIPDSWRDAALSPPCAWGGPLATGALRTSPEDFKVDEILGFDAAGTGPHALLVVRKRGANTEWVARELARIVGCKPFEVGFAGLKDRNAVTTQHFTVPCTAPGKRPRDAAEFAGVTGEGFEVMSSNAHQRKLPRGALAGNRFDIVVRGVDCDAAALADRMARIAAGGVPNYFGPQRFGRDAGNLAAVIAAAGGIAQGRRGRGWSDQGFLLSAARSVIFNAILAERVRAGTWNRLAAGDVANLDGRGSVFPVEAEDQTIVPRATSLEIHPTAPLAGDGTPMSSGEIAALEEAVAARFPEALAVIRAERMKAERRALRIRVREITHDYADGVLRVRFALDAGSFATTVLREIVAAADGED